MDIEAIKAANAIEEVISEDMTITTGRGRYLRGVQHDSLVIDRHGQVYHWNSKNEWGDVIAWLEKRRGMDFRQSVEYLCQRAGLPAPEWGGEDASRIVSNRRKAEVLTIASRFWFKALWGDPGALAYARGRGWTDEVIKKAGLGYTGDKRDKGLADELRMHEIDLKSGEARAVLAAPSGMLVYPCVRGGRVHYFMCRSIAGKTHWNPPVDLVGDRQRYFNHVYSVFEDVVVIVEGPADAITLAQWGIAGIALAGTGLGEDELRALLAVLGKHKTVVIGLDKGVDASKLAFAVGPMARVVDWPSKDVNDWLQEGATEEEARALLEGADSWVELVAAETGKVDGLDRPAALDRAFDLIARLGDFELAIVRGELVKRLGVQVRVFNAMLRAKRGEAGGKNGGDGEARFEVETAGCFVADHLLEMVVVPPEDKTMENGHGPGRWRTRFACRYPSGEVKLVTDLVVDDTRYVPLHPNNRILTERVVLFPAALGERLTLRDLVEQVRGVIRKYVDVDRFYEMLATYYVFFSWQYDSFNTVPYLRMLGDAGTGKSRFLQVVGAMCYRPIFVTGAATTSPIFRLVDRFRGTLICDEMDFRSSDEKADIIKILNTGYQRTQGVVLRSGDKVSGFDTEVFVVYGPKVIATRKRFADWALESRCLTHEAGGPTTRTDIPIDLPAAFWYEEVLPVRNALLRYRMEYWKPEVELDYEQMDVSVEPRLNQVTVALQTLIDDAELREDLRGFIKEYNRQLIVERGVTLTAKVLEALVGLYWLDLDVGRVPPDLRVARIAKATNVLIDYENEEAEEDEDEEGGAVLRVKPKKVGYIIRKEIHLRTERRSDAGRAYCVMWDEERIQAMMKRYGISMEAVRDIVGVLKDGLGEVQGEQAEIEF